MTSPEATSAGRQSPATHAPQRVAVDQRFDADGLYALRSALAAHADDLGAGRVEIEKLIIVASELASNAVRHGGGAGRLRLWLDQSRLRCQVDDAGPGMVDPSAGTRPPEPIAIGGRGLWITRRLSDEVIVATGPRGTTVTVAIRLDSPSPSR